ncbi:MAG TPA: hypothetical protein VNY73_00785 [Bacteroidia bacterium]|nr:hypothetical protein [Bacteroidia bacterium]
MNKKIIIAFIVLFSFGKSFSQADSLARKELKNLTQTVDAIKAQADLLSKSAAAPAATHTVSTGCVDCGRHISWKQALVIGMPVALFLIALFLIAIKLKNEGYQLKNALEDEPNIIDVPNPKYDPANPTAAPATIKERESTQSTSRLIAFLSGMCSIIIAISTVTYYFYIYFRTGQEPNIDKLYDILLALGIGVTPYAFNKVSSAISGK